MPLTQQWILSHFFSPQLCSPHSFLTSISLILSMIFSGTKKLYFGTVTNFRTSPNALLKSFYRTELLWGTFREETLRTAFIINTLLFLFPEEVRETLVGKHQNISLWEQSISFPMLRNIVHEKICDFHTILPVPFSKPFVRRKPKY